MQVERNSPSYSPRHVLQDEAPAPVDRRWSRSPSPDEPGPVPMPCSDKEIRKFTEASLPTLQQRKDWGKFFASRTVADYVAFHGPFSNAVNENIFRPLMKATGNPKPTERKALDALKLNQEGVEIRNAFRESIVVEPSGSSHRSEKEDVVRGIENAYEKHGHNVSEHRALKWVDVLKSLRSEMADRSWKDRVDRLLDKIGGNAAGKAPPGHSAGALRPGDRRLSALPDAAGEADIETDGQDIERDEMNAMLRMLQQKGKTPAAQAMPLPPKLPGAVATPHSAMPAGLLPGVAPGKPGPSSLPAPQRPMDQGDAGNVLQWPVVGAPPTASPAKQVLPARLQPPSQPQPRPQPQPTQRLDAGMRAPASGVRAQPPGHPVNPGFWPQFVQPQQASAGPAIAPAPVQNVPGRPATAPAAAPAGQAPVDMSRPVTREEFVRWIKGMQQRADAQQKAVPGNAQPGDRSAVPQLTPVTPVMPVMPSSQPLPNASTDGKPGALPVSRPATPQIAVPPSTVASPTLVSGPVVPLTPPTPPTQVMPDAMPLASPPSNLIQPLLQPVIAELPMAPSGPVAATIPAIPTNPTIPTIPTPVPDPMASMPPAQLMPAMPMVSAVPPQPLLQAVPQQPPPGAELAAASAAMANPQLPAVVQANVPVASVAPALSVPAVQP